ncbi:MAG: alpha/beta hydrolase [Clostridia bacterium]|nr:alpha/beta hydrolase [Clostridia bacterium]
MKQKAHFIRSQLALWKPFLSSCSLSTARRGQDKIGELMAGTHKGDVVYRDFRIGSLPASMILPSDELNAGVILYLHGGGYTCGGLAYAKGFGTVMAAECGMRVLCVAYRLAPEHPFPAAQNDALDAYGYLLANGYDPSQILLCGESAGGGLVYSLCLRIKEKGWALPAGMITVSPWTDLTGSGVSYENNKKVDPSMTRERLRYFADCYVYGGRTEGRSIYPNRNENEEEDRRRKSEAGISPLFGDLSRMPPSLTFVGGDEIMLDDARAMHERLLAAGCESQLSIREGMWHGYLLYNLAENEKDFDLIRRFVRAHVPHQRKLRWMTLDNAAKIFPAARTRHWSNVFRLSATLNEEVDLSVLQSALDVTVRRFPSIAVRVRRGLFWYYLEQIPKAPVIAQEQPFPLARMPFDDIRRCAFRVVAYERRVAVEFFHALTDGNGGLVFLKTLVAEYIYQKYGEKVPLGNGVLDRLEEPSEAEMEDSFLRYAGPHQASRADTDSFRITGPREPDGFKTNTTFILDAEDILARAKTEGVTVTAYLASALLLAADRLQRERVKNPRQRKHVKVHVPVNLRKIFPSRTLRNFILYAVPGIDPRLGEYEFSEVCHIVQHQMKLQITEKNMAAMIATNVGSERMLAVRVVPLFLKNIIMKSIFNAVGERKSCFSFSNLGAVNMPPEFCRHVERLDFVLGAQASAPYNTSLITYGGKMYLNIIRNMAEPVFERVLYDVLRELGIRAVIESNAREKEN